MWAKRVRGGGAYANRLWLREKNTASSNDLEKIGVRISDRHARGKHERGIT